VLPREGNVVISIYWPTVEHSLWPCAALLLIFIPVSIWHEASWRRTLSEYAALRRAAGAPDHGWPSSGVRLVMGVQPWLLLLASALLAVMVAFGAAVLVAWPRKIVGFDQALNYYDRPFLSAMLVAGIAAIVAGVTLAVEAWSSPYGAVASRVRRGVHAPRAVRKRWFELALRVDPDVPRSVVADHVAGADVLDEAPVGDLEDAVGALSDRPVVGDDEK